MSTQSVNSANVGEIGCRWLRFNYEKCWCGNKAVLKIVSDSRKDTYGMLYFICENKGKIGGCRFFRWCYPASIDNVRSPIAKCEVGNRRIKAEGVERILLCCCFAALILSFVAIFLTLSS